ncbi:MAG: hypothetical protein EXR98_24145 [Gemmataceae bacterium]|nr:hypothetical protein [Gemmataceae bacterium]
MFKDFTYKTQKTWSRERRVVGKAEHLAKGENPRFVVTSLSAEAFDAKTLYEQEYCARGNMENRIKEKKLYLFADRVSCQTMRANQVRLCLSTVAYVVMRALRQFGLKETEMAHAQCDTIRVKLLKIGATIQVPYWPHTQLREIPLPICKVGSGRWLLQNGVVLENCFLVAGQRLQHAHRTVLLQTAAKKQERTMHGEFQHYPERMSVFIVHITVVLLVIAKCEHTVGAVRGIAVKLQQHVALEMKCLANLVELHAEDDILERRARPGKYCFEHAVKIGCQHRAARQPWHVRHRSHQGFVLELMRTERVVDLRLEGVLAAL